MATSAFPTARLALKTTLAAAAGLQGVLVSYGLPSVFEAEFVAVVNGKGRQQFAAVGARRREEYFTIHVLIHTSNSDPADAQTPLERAFVLMAAVEDALRTDPSLGETVRVAELADWEEEDLTGPEARGAQLLVGVACHARI